jgi:dihydrofolate synthase/folylpolyglutamate synthase
VSFSYEEALEYLHGLERFGMKPGLDRTRELLRRLGRPDRRSGRIIHITGTSGKGSVAALVESALRSAGLRTGLYTSPAIESATERIQVDRENISRSDFAALVFEVAQHVNAMVSEGLERATEFEVTTVAAFVHFARCQVDWLVLEVGMGGRFDTTSVIENPVVSCITNISLDHTEWLGSTPEQIAWDKSGIIKPGVPCVTGTHHQGALDVIRRVSASQASALTEVAVADAKVVEFGLTGQVVNLLGARGWYEGVELALLGQHQAANAAVALRVLELAGLGEAPIRAGFRAVHWPGRFEVMRPPGPGRGPGILLDSAHNPAKCEALARALHDYFPDCPIRLVIGMLADKQVDQMVKPLLALAQTRMIWTVTPESQRALGADTLRRICEDSGYQQILTGSSISDALEQALQGAEAGELVVITGSSYTVGPARTWLRHYFGRA